ncbi:MAG: hypothetical protein E6Z53_20930 [Pantoea sp.]|nr:hypothetical protein [Pantoea sp.]
MLTSGLFEYVKTSRDFFWKYGDGYAFDTLLNHVNDFCNGVIVQGVEAEQHLQMLARKPIVGLQGRRYKVRYLADFIEQTAGRHRQLPSFFMICRLFPLLREQASPLRLLKNKSDSLTRIKIQNGSERFRQAYGIDKEGSE